jgi:hypothetical protein
VCMCKSAYKVVIISSPHFGDCGFGRLMVVGGKKVI